MSLRDDLIAAKALIDTPEKWCKEVNRYVNAEGHTVRRCAIGAVGDATSNQQGRFGTARQALVAALPTPFVADEMVSKYNDHHQTNHADIMALFQRAIDAAGGDAA